MPASPPVLIQKVGPEPGSPQEAFLACRADICVFGGAAGGGKSAGLLFSALRGVTDPLYNAVIFRRTLEDLDKVTSIVSQANKFFPMFGGVESKGGLRWRFPSGAEIQFAGMQFDKNVEEWYGTELPWIGIDECQFFGERAIMGLLSRNRSMCSMVPCMRLTCNPDADAYVASLLEWWINQETGYYIPERAGVVRWFTRRKGSDEIVWGDTKEELYSHVPEQYSYLRDTIIKSLTFIPSRAEDNVHLMRNNPEYIGSLLMQPLVERERLLGGNWKIRPTAGQVLNPESFIKIAAVPPEAAAKGMWCRGWDIAATEEGRAADPDWTVGIKMCHYDGKYYIDDMQRRRVGPAGLESLVLKTAQNLDGEAVRIAMEEDPAAAGKIMIQAFVRLLDGFYFKAIKIQNKAKEVRWNGFIAQVEAGNVSIVHGSWNRAFLDEMRDLPAGHDDIIDGCSICHRFLYDRKRVGGIVVLPTRRPF